MSRLIYQAKASVTGEQRAALFDAHVELTLAAKREENFFVRRSRAASARALVAAFGVRYDGKRRSPFAFSSERVRCTDCARSEVTAGPLTRYVWTLLDKPQRSVTLRYCSGCAQRHREYVGSVITSFEPVPEPEAACAA